jgi:hypothetical protein
MHTTFIRTSEPNNSVSQSVSMSWEAGLPTFIITKKSKMPPLGKSRASTVRCFSPVFTKSASVGTLPPSPPHNVRTRADTIAGRRARGPWKRRRGVACGVESACSAAKPSNNTQPWPWVLLNLKNTPNGRSRTSVCRGAQPTSAWDPSSPGVHP